VFGIDPNTGSIFPRVSLRDVTTDQWTFNVGVRDKGIPSLSVETPVTANIQRIGKPVFPSGRYDVTKNENDPVDEIVIPVVASDPLPGVRSLINIIVHCHSKETDLVYIYIVSNIEFQSNLVYEIRGDGLAGEYFKIGADGIIRINKSLFLDDNKTPTYRV
jgi:hypothetical protein